MLYVRDRILQCVRASKGRCPGDTILKGADVLPRDASRRCSMN